MVAEAVVEERQLLKKLRWYDGFVISLATPGFLLGSLGYSVGDLGGWGSVLLWGISAALAFPIMTLYSEMAAMFPDKPGGFPLYAHEGWRKAVWSRLGMWLLLGLQFALAADIVRSAIAPTWNEIGQLAAIAAIRTFLGFFLERDLTELALQTREPGAR